MQSGRSYRLGKIKLFKRITKGAHVCLLCASGKTHRRLGKNQFVRLRRSAGC